MNISAGPDSFTLKVDGTTIVAHIYAAGTQPAPVIVVCTGFGGTQDTPAIVAAAQAFAEAGLHAVTFDYRSFGLSGGEVRQVTSVRKQLDDIRALVRHVRTLPSVDPDRVALWGSSLGGGHALTLAAEDPRIAATVVQVPFNGFPTRVEGRALSDSLRLLRAAVHDRLRGWLGLPPRYVKAVGAPSELAVMVGEGANRTIASLKSESWRNQVAPRGLLDMMWYRPGDGAHRIAGPLLVCVAADDAETQADTTRHLADSAPDGREITYEGTHFDIYRPDVRRRVLKDQVQFLRSTLLGAQGQA